jgi:transposase
MFKGSSLSEDQREAAVALFATGWGSRPVASMLGR